MEEEEGREAAIETKAAALQPNFKSQRVTQDQLNKFKELHRKRLQIKEKSKIHKNSKGCASQAAKRHGKDLNTKKIKDENLSVGVEDSTTKGKSFLQQDVSAVSTGTKKRQKLHWGLDTKERWERKSNM